MNQVLLSRNGAFAAFLSRFGSDAANGDPRFVARNFLLDEGVVAPRAASYEDAGAAADHKDYGEWQGRHRDYLRQHVFLPQPIAGAPGSINPAQPSLCPETFRSPAVFRSFGSSLPSLDLLRVIQVRSMARAMGTSLRVREADLVAWGREVVETRGLQSEDVRRLGDALQRWSVLLDLRPAFAAFWEDHKDLFRQNPADDEPDWADCLRDRLGLLHISPAGRLPEISIFVFRYPVRAIPRRIGSPADRALAVPTVLDSDLFEAFCPAPIEEQHGRVLDLSASYDEPLREVVHPFLAYRPEHLFRVGVVRKPPAAPLTLARAAHLSSLRAVCNRADYAVHTDGDLLGR